MKLLNRLIKIYKNDTGLHHNFLLLEDILEKIECHTKTEFKYSLELKL